MTFIRNVYYCPFDNQRFYRSSVSYTFKAAKLHLLTHGYHMLSLDGPIAPVPEVVEQLERQARREMSKKMDTAEVFDQARYRLLLYKKLGINPDEPLSRSDRMRLQKAEAE
jgi:hypothetical protein